jgi:phosphoribosylformimino-5-aminoimidazole carboxamide ribonucleotide (ProFAR) isomerase
MWFDLPIEVIPAVDVLGDEAVRLTRGRSDEVV